MQEIRAILFDLGGVLIRLRGHRVLLHYLPEDMTEEELLQRWLHSATVRAFESGRMDLSTFCHDILMDLGLHMDEAAFLHVFQTFLEGPFPEVAEKLTQLSARHVTGILSNTSAPHWQAALDMLPVLETLPHQFLSYRMGMLKPDREIFEEVLRRLDLPAESVLYFDDHPLNVKTARMLGIQAVQAVGFEEALEALTALGLLPIPE